MIVGAFEFEEDGRSYRCAVQGEHSSRTGAWWWFDVTGDAQRYAPFRAESGDTQNSVRARIVEYYGALLVRRAMPPVPRYGQGRPRKPVVALDSTGDRAADATNASRESAQDGGGDHGGGDA